MDANDPLRGIVHRSADGSLSHLPLEEVAINVFVVDVSARVTLRQVFSNTSSTPTSRGKYVFPVPSRAAVCAFEMHFADGRVITGVSKEKGQAAEEHTQALEAGKTTALVEWLSDDVFTISIGSIPAKQTVTTKLVFVMDLMDDDNKDEVRLQLPMSVGSRYGPDPPSLADAAAASSRTRLRITVDIQMSGVIRRVSCPNHEGLINLSPYVTRTGQSSRRRKTARLRSQTFLARDFVLVVHADGLDSPRCFAERDDNGSGTIAMQLTFVPNIKLPPIPDQEFLFVVDRSGSMSGNRIMVAKRALAMLLRFLPNEGTKFNIISFGSNHAAYSESGSLVYSAASLKDATEHVTRMAADFGGTELESALRYTFRRRDPSIATVVFVLTDGEIMAADETIAEVGRAVQSSQPNAALRVFSLGIGDTVSSAVIEGIARAGNGECLFAVESEQIVGKCAKLFRTGRSSFVDNISINWGDRGSTLTNADASRGPSSVSFSNPASPGQPTRVELAPPAAKQQSPAHITQIRPGMRFIVFVIMAEKRIPKEVVLTGQLNGGHEQMEIVTAVSSVKVFSKKSPDVPLIHTLAARRLITDLVEGSGDLPTSVNQATPEDVRKAAIIRLGEKYQLASRYTSFVAVDQGTETSRRNTRGRTRGRQERRRSVSPNDNQNKDMLSLVMDGVSSILNTMRSFFDQNPSRGRRIVRHLPGEYMTSSSTSTSPSPTYLNESGDEQEWDRESTESFSTLSSLEGSFSDWSTSGSPERRQRRTGEDETRTRSPSPPVENRRTRKQNTRHSHASSTSGDPQATVPPVVYDLVMQQSFDGSFSLDDSLGGIVGESALQKPTDVEGDDTIWATAIVVAFLQKTRDRVGRSDVLDGLLEKAMEFIEKGAMTKTRFELLVSRAKGLVV